MPERSAPMPDDEETCYDCEEYRKEIDVLNNRIKELEAAIGEGSKAITRAIDEAQTAIYHIDGAL